MVIFLSRERKGVKAKEGEKVKCPICGSQNCTKKEIGPSLVEFVCSVCTTFTIHKDILQEHLYGAMRKRDREIVSAMIKHHFEKDRNPVRIVLWHSKAAASGVTEKTISELKKEGKTIFKGLIVRS